MKAALVLLALIVGAQAGPCRGGAQPSSLCKTCEYCSYCGTDKGRAHNSATCSVCEKNRAAEAAKKSPPK